MSFLRLRLLRTTLVQKPSLAQPPSTRRLFHQTTKTLHPYKDDMDRESLKPKRHEYTQSGTDEETASEHGDASFDPKKTSPEEANETAAEGAAQKHKGNPLEASPADHGFAEGGKGNTESKPTRGQNKKSGAGSPKKAGKTA